MWSKTNGQKIILSQLAAIKEDVCTILCKYEMIDAGKITHTEIEELKVKIYEQDKLLGLLQSLGFKHIKTLRAFDQSAAPTEQDEVVVYECRK